MKQLRVEISGESGGYCDCCGNATRTIWGYVHEHDRTIAAYFIQWTRNRADHFPNFDFLIGTWGDENLKDKVLVSWLFDPTRPGGSFMAIDSADRPAADSDLCNRTLTREQLIGDPDMLASAKTLIDAVWLGDPRLEEIRRFTTDA